MVAGASFVQDPTIKKWVWDIAWADFTQESENYIWIYIVGGQAFKDAKHRWYFSVHGSSQ